MIILNPKAGLCNRMQAIDSSLALARKFNTKLHVIWIRNSACNSRFHDLFSTKNLPYKVTELREGTASRLLNKHVRKLSCRLNNFHLGQKKMNRFLGQRKWFEALSKHRHIYINTYCRFYHTPREPLFTGFQPKNPLQQIIETYRLDNRIGVHVRRTDNKNAIAHSPTSSFIEQMNKELSKDPNVTFFLSTDEPAVEHKLQSEFPGKIVVHKKQSLDRNNPPAIQDAVIDLYSLANCRKLIGSYWSSFSHTASEINEIERVVIYKRGQVEY